MFCFSIELNINFLIDKILIGWISLTYLIGGYHSSPAFKIINHSNVFIKFYY